MAGVMPTRRLSCAAMSHSQLPNTSVYVILPGAVAGLMPSAGLNFGVPWYRIGSASASL
ncbi:hypothetical protein D3C72_1487210 [compost metagenome]